MTRIITIMWGIVAGWAYGGWNDDDCEVVSPTSVECEW